MDAKTVREKIAEAAGKTTVQARIEALGGILTELAENWTVEKLIEWVFNASHAKDERMGIRMQSQLQSIRNFLQQFGLVVNVPVVDIDEKNFNRLVERSISDISAENQDLARQVISDIFRSYVRPVANADTRSQPPPSAFSKPESCASKTDAYAAEDRLREKIQAVAARTGVRPAVLCAMAELAFDLNKEDAEVRGRMKQLFPEE